MTHSDLTARLWDLAETVRVSAPLVHNITNLVVQNDTADAIAAAGATQITLHNLEEAREVAALCAAAAINLGTLNEPFLQCAREAVTVAASLGRPWVLDPVAAGFTAYRTAAAREFLGMRPTVLKANASEILVLAGHADGGRGAESIHSVENAAEAARNLARRYGSVVVVSGPQDMITDGARGATVSNGHPLMGRMIGSGCMLTSVIGAFVAAGDSHFETALAAVAYFGVAGELAAERADGPGTFKPLFIDALHNLGRETFDARVRVTAPAAGDGV